MSGNRKPGLPAATSLVVASMIGTGVFISLGFQLYDFRSGPQIMALWIMGGLIALCGAISYARLAEIMPRSGGEFRYLGETYHPSLGFMAGLLSAVVGFTFPTAITALALGGYLQKAVPWIDARTAAAVVVVIGAAAHGMGARVSGRVQLASTAIKLLLIGFFLIAALVMPGKGDIRWSFSAAEDLPALGTPAFAIALYYVFYSYSGWNAAVYGLEEWDQPEKTTRRALCIGTVIVIALYAGLNAAFLKAAPVAALRGNQELAHASAAALFGDGTGRLVSGLFALGLFASVSALLWAGPRVLAAMARETPALGFFAAHHGVPLRPLLFQTIIAVALVLIADIEFLITYTQTGLALCTLLSVAALFV